MTISAYSTIYALGHRYVSDLLSGPVVVEEKVDGSQFSFRRKGEELFMRSRGQDIDIDNPPAMFRQGVEYVKSIKDQLVDGWIYRGEYLQKPKHNVLAYGRIPTNHIAIFDVARGMEDYLTPEEKATEAGRLGFDCVPLISVGMFSASDGLFQRPSYLGNVPIEGVVVKNYERFGQDGKILIGKFVSDAFKEQHKAAGANYSQGYGEVVEAFAAQFRTPARFQKAVAHLREVDQIADAPQDIPKLIAEVGADVEREHGEQIRDQLYKHFWPQIRKSTAKGLAEWYKGVLFEQQAQVAAGIAH